MILMVGTISRSLDMTLAYICNQAAVGPSQILRQLYLRVSLFDFAHHGANY